MRESKIQLNDAMPLLLEKLNEGYEVTFSPRGTSMLPFLREGRDTVTLASKNRKLKKYDVAFYQRKNGQYVLHRVIKVGKTYTFIGDNQFVREKGIEAEQIIAICSSVLRKGKRITASSFAWRAHAVFLHCSRPLRRVVAAVRRRIIKSSENVD